MKKPVHWMGSSYKDLCSLSSEVQRAFGQDLLSVQWGGRPKDAKPWKGEGPGVLEIVEDHRGDTFRAVYTVRFAKAVYVLHVFQKKSKHGIKTDRNDRQLIASRLRDAEYIMGCTMVEMKLENNVWTGSGDVLVDLGIPDAEELGTKVRLAVAINNILDQRELSQAEAAKLLGVNQPKISALQNYKMDGFSVERLMHFITALEYDVVIELRPHAASDSAARVVVVEAA